MTSRKRSRGVRDEEARGWGYKGGKRQKLGEETRSMDGLRTEAVA